MQTVTINPDLLTPELREALAKVEVTKGQLQTEYAELEKQNKEEHCKWRELQDVADAQKLKVDEVKNRMVVIHVELKKHGVYAELPPTRRKRASTTKQAGISL